MSGLGQKQTFRDVRVMSALTPKADMPLGLFESQLQKSEKRLFDAAENLAARSCS